MKKNSLLILSIVTVVFVSIAANSAWAGNVQRNRWEGVAIGVGAVVLGKVLWDQYTHPRPEPAVVYPEPQRRRPRNHYRPRPSGHWEIRRVWVPMKHKKVWNPGHYGRRGRWVPGKWIKIKKKDGHWKEERVWVAENHHRPYVD